MTALDWVLLLIIAVSALMGAWRGMIGVVASIAAWIAAGLAAFHLGGDVGALLAAGDAPSWGERVSGYVLAFGVVWVLVMLAGWMLRKLADSVGLTPFDRALGLGLGTARGVFLACALLLALALSTMPHEPVWRDSAGVAALMPMTAWMRGGVPDWMGQQMDLEGRGVSLETQLQRKAQAVQAALPPGMTLADLAALPAPVDEHAQASPAREVEPLPAPAVGNTSTSRGATGDSSAAARVN